MTPRTPLRRLWDNLVARTVGYYIVLFAVVGALWAYVPGAARVLLLDSGAPTPPVGASKAEIFGAAAEAAPVGAMSQMVSAATAMMVAALLCLPVAWLYILTRRRKGFRQSVVHTLIVLPLVVAGVVVLVKTSLALAFSLAGIVAAVRFRNTLEDSKDAVYIFLATAIGLASGVDLPVALVISVFFNGVALALWHSDFGRSPALEGRLAERRLARAMEQMSRTGTFVARVDEQMFQDMSAEQLAAVADRAWRRARRHNPEMPDQEGRREALLRIRTEDVQLTRLTMEPLLDEHLKRWRFGGVVHEPDGTHVVEYAIVLRKSVPIDKVLEILRGQGEPIRAVEIA